MVQALGMGTEKHQCPRQSLELLLLWLCECLVPVLPERLLCPPVSNFKNMVSLFYSHMHGLFFRFLAAFNCI